MLWSYSLFDRDNIYSTSMSITANNSCSHGAIFTKIQGIKYASSLGERTKAARNGDLKTKQIWLQVNMVKRIKVQILDGQHQ